MALHVEVTRVPHRPEELMIHGEWEHGGSWPTKTFVPEPGMTAAEAVEFYMLQNHNMVASWTWSSEIVGSFATGKRVLHGEFVHGGNNGAPNHKEVKDSRADRFDL